MMENGRTCKILFANDDIIRQNIWGNCLHQTVRFAAVKRQDILKRKKLDDY